MGTLDAMSFPSQRAYRILTERLELACYEASDAEELQAVTARNKEHLSPFMKWALNEPQTLDEKLELIRDFRSRFDSGTEYVYRVKYRDDPRLIGGTGLRPKGSSRGLEIGYWTDAEECGKGVATELTAALTRFALEVLEPSRIVIHCQIENEVSNRIPEKLGFHKEGTLRRALSWPEEANRDVHVWTLLPEELAASVAASAKYEAFDDLGRSIGVGE